MAYRKAPYYDNGYELISEILSYEEPNLSKYVLNSIVKLNEYLDIKTEIISTSAIYPKHNLKGQDRILDICEQEGAEAYYNPIGGMELYNREAFKLKNINLLFIKTTPKSYDQLHVEEFIPNLSIIDVIMNNSVSEISSMMKEYALE